MTDKTNFPDCPHINKCETWDEAAALALEIIEDLAFHQIRWNPSSVEKNLATIDTQLDVALNSHEQQQPRRSERALEIVAATAYNTLLNQHQSTQTVFDTCLQLLVDRHHKYGAGNINRAKHVGLIIRMGDKHARLQNNAGDFEDETMIDAWYDLVGYGTISVMLANNWFNLPLTTR